MMLIPTLALLCLAGGQAEVALAETNNVTEVVIKGPDNVEVGVGEEAILVCEVEQPSKFCMFINPAGKTFILDPHSQHEEGRISYAGSEEEEVKTSCGVKISPVVEADEGDWRCEMHVMVEIVPVGWNNRMLQQWTKIARMRSLRLSHSTTNLPEADGDYLKENLHGAKDKNQTTSTAPQLENEINPSAGNSDKYLKVVVEESQEEDRKDASTDLTEEQVVVVTIICLMIVAIILTAIAKIKKLLCFRVTSTENAEDAEKSTLRMYSMEKSSKSSLKSGDMANDGVKEGNYP